MLQLSAVGPPVGSQCPVFYSPHQDFELYLLPWLNFTRPPLCPKIKKRNIPEYSKKPGYSIFWQFWYVPCIFFGIFQNFIYPTFSEIGMSQNWKWNIPIFQVIPKNWSRVCPKYFLEYPIFQICKTCVCPRFNMEYPGIFPGIFQIISRSQKNQIFVCPG